MNLVRYFVLSVALWLTWWANASLSDLTQNEDCVGAHDDKDDGSPPETNVSMMTLPLQELHSAQADWDDLPQDLRNDTTARQVWKTTHDYMTQTVLVKREYNKVRNVCRNKVATCTWHAANGACTIDGNHKHWMRENCAPACQSCHLLDINKRCPVNRTAPGIFGPGDLHHMYERIVRDFGQYEPVIHSKPGGDPSDPTVRDGPWIVTLESFLSQEEAQNLIQIAEHHGLEPSIGRVVQMADGTYERTPTKYRTSSSAYCFDECYQNPATRQFNTKLEQVTGTPHSHSTFLHFLRYQQGQFYGQHSDYIRKHHREQQHGVRILTALTYLSDVPSGGGTHFPYLNLTVTPKRGRVLIFPNILNDKVTTEEKMTPHEALPVQQGVKYAVSMYVHQKDYKTPFYEQCIRS